MSASAPLTLVDPAHGFRRLAVPPAPAETDALYAREYHDPNRAPGRAPDVRRLASRSEDAQRERAWLAHTLHADIAAWLEANAPGRRVLDVGCGTGELLAFLQARGFEASGIEPGEQAAAAAIAEGLDVRQAALDDVPQDSTFDAVVMLNVLEHLSDAEHVLAVCRGLLRPGGVLIVRVPNDFSELQRAAERTTVRKQWWVVSPDHIHYFDFRSLRSVLEAGGFEVLAEQSDFPMELFVLMGDNYVDDTALGAACHRRRVQMELSLPREARRKLYASFAAVGMGRNCMMVARRGRT